MTKDKIKIGIAGEFLAASKLSELGYIVGVTRKNTPGIDILISNGIAAKNIQIKTTDTINPDWVCNKPKIVNENLIYIFIKLNRGTDNPPSFHIVPSKEVDKYIDKGSKIYNKKYLDKHGKPYDEDGKKGGVFKFKDMDLKYKDKWDLLGLPLVE
jgi:hypothetical protein